eukprot:UN27252
MRTVKCINNVTGEFVDDKYCVDNERPTEFGDPCPATDPFPCSYDIDYTCEDNPPIEQCTSNQDTIQNCTTDASTIGATPSPGAEQCCFDDATGNLDWCCTGATCFIPETNCVVTCTGSKSCSIVCPIMNVHKWDPMGTGVCRNEENQSSSNISK